VLGRSSFFEVANTRYQERVAAWPDLRGALRTLAEWMAGLEQGDYRRLVAVIEWLSEHRNSGLFMRQLPIEGLDTKWLERHAGPIARLLAERIGLPGGPLAAVAGLRTEPVRRRLRLLDPVLRTWAHGMSDIELPLDEIRTLDIPARVALVVENNITALSCTDLSGAVLIMGGGLAVTELGAVPWLAGIPIVYWGDIDTWGFSILASLRRYHSQTVSCLMDEATLWSHLHLRSHEPNPARTVGEGLLAVEHALFAKLVEGREWGAGLRIEQERLDWSSSWRTVEHAVRTARTLARSSSHDQISF